MSGSSIRYPTLSLLDPTIIGGKGVELFNTLLKYAYVGLLLTCFILSLGNRPLGSNKRYTLAYIGFSIFNVYMTVHLGVGHAGVRFNPLQFAAIFLAVKRVQRVAAAKNRGATLSHLFMMRYSAILLYRSRPPLDYACPIICCLENAEYAHGPVLAGYMYDATI
ncbi:hypothetical protein EDB87DRAFT_674883 [Lactarius vividus]|nr:hypothetical protein EDB87DRAFT_674883 [Lactarius vividus]